MPAQHLLNPDQQRSQKRQTDKLTRRIKTNGGSAFMFREPAGHHPVIGRESGRFENTGYRTQTN
ncbi:hypothetical protein BX55_04035 [Escherichia coli O26:H11 str. 2010C-3871]|nr:hypothetical protein BX55_04035 [Escherichia coli O26:H11 str. 2010C-3871]